MRFRTLALAATFAAASARAEVLGFALPMAGDAEMDNIVTVGGVTNTDGYSDGGCLIVADVIPTFVYTIGISCDCGVVSSYVVGCTATMFEGVLDDLAWFRPAALVDSGCTISGGVILTTEGNLSSGGVVLRTGGDASPPETVLAGGPCPVSMPIGGCLPDATADRAIRARSRSAYLARSLGAESNGGQAWRPRAFCGRDEKVSDEEESPCNPDGGSQASPGDSAAGRVHPPGVHAD